jgi:peptide/nickel transport system substrate-binding protein
MLTEMVEEGVLPPVDDRVPLEPLVEAPAEQIGTYGGTLRMGEVQQNRHAITSMIVIGFFRSSQDGTTVTPDILESYKWDDEGKVLTFYLRKGHKWSDGEPFTTDDLMFWWDDYMTNTDLRPVLPQHWSPGDEAAKVTKVSDVEIQFEFAVPNWVLMDRFRRAAASGWDGLGTLPAHYMKQFHADYNEDAAALAEEEGYEDWIQFFGSKASPADRVGLGKPDLKGWVATSVTTDRYILERNPYFHWVDPEGNQLPYIDVIDAEITGDREVQILKTTTGAFDFSTYYLSLSDMPALQEGKEQGGYEVLLANQLRTSMMHLTPNQNSGDEVMRELFSNKDFRIALSIAINRDAMNEALFFGLGTPHQATVHPDTPFYKEEWGKVHIEYDPDRANQILDDLGLTDKDSEGYRLRPDGEGRLAVRIDIGNEEGPKVEMAEMVREDWANIGIEAAVNFMTRPVWEERRLQWEDLSISTWHTGRAVMPYGRSSSLWFGYDSNNNRWGPGWVQWFLTDGEEGIEPPERIKEHKALFDKFLLTQWGTEESYELGEEYYKFFTDELVMIGTVGLQPQPIVVSNRLHNVPTEGINWGSDNSFHNPYRPCQFYLEEA